MATRAATTKTPTKPATMTRRDFFSDVLEAVRRSLPPERQEFEARQTMNLLKISYGANYRIHYEAWVNAERGYVELGLHFEDGPASTERLLRHFEASILRTEGPARRGYRTRTLDTVVGTHLRDAPDRAIDEEFCRTPCRPGRTSDRRPSADSRRGIRIGTGATDAAPEHLP